MASYPIGVWKRPPSQSGNVRLVREGAVMAGAIDPASQGASYNSESVPVTSAVSDNSTLARGSPSDPPRVVASPEGGQESPEWHSAAKVQVVGLGIVIILALAAILAYGLTAKSAYLQTCGLLGLVGVAAGFAGAFFGFLFGIPRSIVSARGITDTAAGDERQKVGAVVGNLDPDATQPNTNLEQISDWLTKILVGATLTQLGHIPAALGSLFATIGSAIGNDSSDTVFVGALTIYTGLAGFVQGWIAARVWLPWFIRVIPRHSKRA
jgi:hypothetical protein